jgi:hypothetical protein
MPRRLAAIALTTIFFLAATASAGDLAAAMKEVERLRGVTFEHPVATRTVPRSELPQLLRAQMEKSLPYSADDYALILRALQLVDAGDQSNLVGKMMELYESQVLAFYDPLSHTYFALSELPPAASSLGAGSDLLTESVVIHELTHALQDQRFAAGARDLALQRDTDAALAYHSVLEGEATLVMLAWMANKVGQSVDVMMQNDSLVAGIAAAASADTSIGASTPRYFVEELKFPYVEGLRFVVAAYKHGGGWKGLDAVHAHPPRSTREVLHPDEYFARVARGDFAALSFDNRAPSALTVEHLGEFHWRFLVGDAASGWIDDRVVVAQDERCEPTVLVETSWESADRARAFRSAYEQFLRGRGIIADSHLDGTRVRVAYGADSILAAHFVK